MSEPCTCERCNAKQNRIAAFGAIRRAAEVAREEDRRVIEYREIYKDPVISAVSEVVASGIRFAIRAAIGSDKA